MVVAAVDPELLEILACPECKSPVRLVEEGRFEGEGMEGVGALLVCTNRGCGLAYAVRDGIPVMLVEEAFRPGTWREVGEG